MNPISKPYIDRLKQIRNNRLAGCPIRVDKINVTDHWLRKTGCITVADTDEGLELHLTEKGMAQITKHLGSRTISPVNLIAQTTSFGGAKAAPDKELDDLPDESLGKSEYKLMVSIPMEEYHRLKSIAALASLSDSEKVDNYEKQLNHDIKCHERYIKDLERLAFRDKND